MTPRQIVDNLLRGRPAPRMGLTNSPWGDTLAAWVREGYPTRMEAKEVGEQRWCPDDGGWVEVPEAGEFEEPVPPWEHFAYDLAVVGGWFDVMPLRGHSELVEGNEQWVDPAERRRGGPQVLEAQVGHARACRLPHGQPPDLGARLPAPRGRVGPGAGEREGRPQAAWRRLTPPRSGPSAGTCSSGS